MKMFFNWNRAAVVLAGLCTVALTASVGNAGAISPSFDSFGTLAGATFKMDPNTGAPVSSGIPNTAVAITTIDDGSGNTFMLGLTAHQRYTGPNLINDGAGTFTATSGQSSVAPPGAATWNVAYYVEVLRGSADGYGFELLYDFDPAVGTVELDLGTAVLTTFVNSTRILQDSQNVGFSFLAANFPPFVTAPAFSPFDPSANGQYSFALIARGVAGGEIGRSALLVNSVPEPATMAMFAMIAVGAAGAYRRKNRVAAAC